MSLLAPQGVAEIIRQAGRIDVLINNAGQGCIGPLAEVSSEQVRQTFDVNVFGLISMVQAVSPIMVQQRSGTSAWHDALGEPKLTSALISSRQHRFNRRLRSNTVCINLLCDQSSGSLPQRLPQNGITR